jgi:hypothetical protein
MIDEYHFGKMVINNKTYTKDLIIIGNEVHDNWWRKEGHKIDWDDLSSFLKEGVEIVIIGTGERGLMQPTDILQKRLKEKGIKIMCSPTGEAIKTFNKHQKAGKTILGAFHLTC